MKHFRINPTRKPAGSNVWELYEVGDVGGIEARTASEVRDMILLYQSLRRRALSR
jgi:hypothetical protein